MGPKIVPRFQNEKVQQLIRVSREIKVDKVQNNVQWAMEVRARMCACSSMGFGKRLVFTVCHDSEKTQVFMILIDNSCP